MSPQAEGEPRNDAGTGGDVDDLAARLIADPQALQEYIASQNAKVRELQQQNSALEQFRVLTLDVVRALGEAGRQAS